ncbi:hypothetical protein EV175_000596 [Coemansia sp. RSA 1933]|nr:hypothetical protein EV175_000596 [Coemansia sp. RSA 1933]
MGFANSPRSMGGYQNTVQRKGSMASIAADDSRATPTPSESSIGGQMQTVTYTAEEVANAQRKSGEFLKRLPEFTSESFVEFLQKFLKDNDVSGNFSKPPVFGDKSIDLYRFFCEVVRQGGLEQVHAKRVWRQVAKDSGLPDIPTLPPLLSRWYKVWLQPLEQLAVFPPGHPKHTGINANFSLKKRRKADTFGSPGSTPGPIERPYSVNPEASKRPKMYSPIANGAASATASPAPFTPPPPMPISSSAMQLSTGSMGLSSAQATSAPSFPTNGFTPTPIRSLPPQMPVPRTLDTYGGIDMQVSAALRPRVLIPSVSDYGSVDIRALTLSIESGIVMEVTAALNTLIQITSHPEVVVPLGQCEELAEALFSIVENVKLTSAYAPGRQELDSSAMDEDSDSRTSFTPIGETAVKPLSYSGEAELFDALHTNDPDDGGMIGDDLQDPTSVCGLIHGSDDLWSFTSDRTLTVVYALRNMSFVQMNQQYLSTSSDFLHMFRTFLEKCERAVQAARDWSSDNKMTTISGKLASLIVLRALEFRKSMMVMLVNVADRIDLKAAGKEFVDAALRLMYYFMDEKQTSDIVEGWMRESVSPAAGATMSDPLAYVVHVQAHDGRTYYLHALEAVGRMTLSDNNRELLAGAASPADAYWPLANACISLLAGNQAAVSLNPNTVHNFTENRLMWVQMALVVFSNLVCTVTPQLLVASRRYTPFRISPSGVIGGPAHVNGVPGMMPNNMPKMNGIAAGASPGSGGGGGGSRRARTRHTLPFVPMVYTTTAVPSALKDFRKRLASNDDVVRSLFEMVFMWWMHVGAAVNLRTNQGGPLSPSAPYDSPLNDIAERAVYVLQQLHPEHDSLFTGRWSEWVVERATRVPLCSELMEVLYELTGMIPVQSVPLAKPSSSS